MNWIDSKFNTFSNWVVFFYMFFVCVSCWNINSSYHNNSVSSIVKSIKFIGSIFSHYNSFAHIWENVHVKHTVFLLVTFRISHPYELNFLKYLIKLSNNHSEKGIRLQKKFNFSLLEVVRFSGQSRVLPQNS